MKAYILKIVGAALLSAFSEYLVPKEWQKYIKLLSGFIIISILISPFTSKNTPDLFEDFRPDTEYTVEEGEKLMYENLREELEKKVEEDIVLRVFEEFSQNVTADVTIKTDSEGKIESVKRIELTGKKNDNITERLKFAYGTEEVIWIE